MEGEPDESDEDVHGEEKTTVLWEKCIQQSIFVDLSEDESLNLSDLESSLCLHLSQAESAASEASIHLNVSAELSALDDNSSDSSVAGSQSERVVQSKSSIFHVSAQRPNIVKDELPVNQQNEDPGQNTSDEDQEDLPYDCDLGSHYFNHSSDESQTVNASPEAPGLHESRDDAFKYSVSVEPNTEKPATSWQEVAIKQADIFDGSKLSEVNPSCTHSPVYHRQPDINQLLLRHFSKEELLQTGMMIEAETLPEVSLLESTDDILYSLAPTHNSTAVSSNYSENPVCNHDINQTDDKSDNTTKNSTLEDETEKNTDSLLSAATDSSRQDSRDNSALDVVEPEESEDDGHIQKVPFVRTRSFSEMKYGQGQVHYPLPDFSKVAPKVKIPKAPIAPARPVPQAPSTMHRSQSSPGMLELISRVLEDSVQPSEKPHIFKDPDEQTAPALVHHLQAEYDKLLTKYAEAENLIDKMRLGTNTQPPSDIMIDQGNVGEEIHPASLAAHILQSENFGEKVKSNHQNKIKELNKAGEESPSDGEKMTAELKDIISQFMQTVEDFKQSVNNMSVSTAEQQMMLRSMMEAQDQLERKYISKKEEHRALEMQNYMGLTRNTGTFDPNRLVEGDIFRVGMHLEDIKEVIDRNMCEQMFPPHSSSTPTPIAEPLLPSPPSPTDSPPSSLHEGPSAGFTGYEMETRTEEDNKEDDASERHGNDGFDKRSKLITQDSLLKNKHGSCRSRSSQSSLEGLDIPAAEDEENNDEERSSDLSEGIVSSNILAYLSRTSSSSRQRQCTHERGAEDSVLNPVGQCDLVDCVSLAVEVSSSSYAPGDPDTYSQSNSPLDPSSLSQKAVSPETDSGFGSSYLSQSASGTFQPNLPESVKIDGPSSSDSEGSCSNLLTAIHPAELTDQPLTRHHPSVLTQSCGATAAVELWVQSTAIQPSVRLRESDPTQRARLHHHVSEPILSTAMETAQGHSHLSEAILALQSEVSRLKKDLEEGLLQLPHLAQKMEYLASKYKQDHQEHRSKTRTRTHHRPGFNSLWKPTSSRHNVSSELSSSQVKVEDWISSDMDPRSSKGTDSGDKACSEVMLQFYNTPAGSRRGSSSVACSASEFHYKLQGTLQASTGSEGISSVKASRRISSGLRQERDSKDKQRQKTVIESFYSKERWSLLSPPTLQRPLLQVSYGSSSSLPASYKVREPPLQSVSHCRKRSTQSDTALLPSNVYFQRTLSPSFSKACSRTGSKRSHAIHKEQDMNRNLDKAIEVAHSMKRTTDRIARSLSADLAKAQLQRSIQPEGGRKHHVL